MYGTIDNHFSEMSDATRSRTVSIISLALIFLFAYTAISKIIDHKTFETGLSQVELVGPYATYISWAVPLLELVTVVLLVVPNSTSYGLILFLFLMIMFTVYIASVLLWAKVLPCNCGGVIEKLTWSQHLWFNIAFMLIALYGLRLIKNQKQI